MARKTKGKTAIEGPRRARVNSEKIRLPLLESRNLLKYRELRDFSKIECAESVTHYQGPAADENLQLIKKMAFSKNVSLSTTLGYTPAKLVTGKRWFVEFYAYDPEIGGMHRKRISVKPCKTVSLRRMYANELVKEINDKLFRGWNPFEAQLSPKQYVSFEKVVSQYFKFLQKLTEEDLMRIKTFNGYVSYMNVFRSWAEKQGRRLMYAYQFKRETIEDFLEHLWIHEGKSARTRDNYLAWLRSFAKYMLEKEWISEDPTAGMAMIQGKRKVEKNRTVIPRMEMQKLKEHLMEYDRYFLLASYILYYCFIRPKEMSFIRLRDINIKSGTIIVHGEVSKNRKGDVVTLPDCVVKLMLSLNIFSASDECFLFSDGCRPGLRYRSAKQFTDRWTALRNHFRWPNEYKFYSLKDTGITDMITDQTDMLAVRDQARHSSLEMTDKYTPLWSREANEKIRHRESYF